MSELEPLTSVRGEHIHHGYFLAPSDTKEKAQLQLIELLLERSALRTGVTVLDVGCGIGGTTRYLARERGCSVTGITISGNQVQMARRLTASQAHGEIVSESSGEGFAALGEGKVRFIELDAEKMGDFFDVPEGGIPVRFDTVWISEAMSHLPNKKLFFTNAFRLLKVGGKLVVADWFKAEELGDADMEADIKPIEGKQFGELRCCFSTLIEVQMACCYLHCVPYPNTSSSPIKQV